MLPKFSPLVWRYAADFTAVGAAITLRLGSMLRNFTRWCRRFAAYLTVVGRAFYTTARVNAARFSFRPLALPCWF